MYFRDCLIILTSLFEDKEFDAETLSTIITEYLHEQGHALGHPELPKKFTTKRISSDLDRLHRMGFLRARRAKRRVSTKTGAKCFRGYKYLYRTTKQGIRYNTYLRNPEVNGQSWARIYQKQGSFGMLFGVPPVEYVPELLDVFQLDREIQARSTRQGRFSRFPSVNDDSIAVKYIIAKQLLHKRLDMEHRYAALTGLESLGQKWASILTLQSPGNRQAKTLLHPDSEYRYLRGLLSRRV